jgi:hypothetical protein
MKSEDIKELIDVLNESTFKNKPDAKFYQAYDSAEQDSRYSPGAAKSAKIMKKYLHYSNLTIREIYSLLKT